LKAGDRLLLLLSDRLDGAVLRGNNPTRGPICYPGEKRNFRDSEDSLETCRRLRRGEDVLEGGTSSEEREKRSFSRGVLG